MNRGREAAERYAERRRREDEAPRLRDIAPRLTSCRMELEDGRAESVTAEISHTRRIVIEHAPALFIIPCGDPTCKDGGHDVTSVLLRGLREERTEIRGEDLCRGYTGPSPCKRILRYAVFSEFEG
jgi:hypothetical protein